MSKVNRIEVIDWTASNKGDGRAYTKWVKESFNVQYDIQDDGRTLKIFLGDENNASLTDLLESDRIDTQSPANAQSDTNLVSEGE